jgi:hypothetical protein
MPERLAPKPIPTPGGAPGGARLAALPGPTATPPRAPSLAEDPRQALLAAVAAQRAKPSWHARVVATTGDDAFVQTVAFTAPDRYHVYQPGIAEALAVGETGWLKDGEAWRESPQAVAVARAAAQMVRATGELDAAILPETLIRRLDTEWLNGQRLRPLRFAAGPAPEGRSPVTFTWWLREADGLPMRIERHGGASAYDTVIRVTFDYGLAPLVAPPAAAILPAATAAARSGEVAPDNPAPAWVPPSDGPPGFAPAFGMPAAAPPSGFTLPFGAGQAGERPLPPLSPTPYGPDGRPVP